MGPKSDNVQRLLDAEARRNRMVNDAKARKAEKVRSAKADAEAAVSEFRREKDAEFETFRRLQADTASSGNIRFDAEIDQQIADMKKIAERRMDTVADMLVNLVCTTKL